MGAQARILVVEDDPKVIIFIEDNLENMGYQVLTARNGAEGLEKAREAKPDLLVLDVMMPEMDGYEVCSQLKADPETRGIPILMLTAKGQLQDKVKGLDIGADDYLAKPYEKAEFEARVKALLRRSVFPPFASGPNIKKLKGFKPPIYRIRSGDFRVLYRVYEKTIIILRVIDRKSLERVIKKLNLSKS